MEPVLQIRWFFWPLDPGSGFGLKILKFFVADPRDLFDLESEIEKKTEIRDKHPGNRNAWIELTRKLMPNLSQMMVLQRHRGLGVDIFQVPPVNS
jgi:hypothetical protein